MINLTRLKRELIIAVFFFAFLFTQGVLPCFGDTVHRNPDGFIKQLVANIYSEWPDPENKKISAVLPFYRQSIENSNAFGTYLAETCSDIMVEKHQLKVVSRSRLRNFIEELEFQQDELVQKSTRKDLGQFLGADYILIGNFWYLGSGIKVSVRVYDVESAYALTAASVFIPSKNVPEDFLREIKNDYQVDTAASEDNRKKKLEEIGRQEAERKKASEKKTILSISTVPENADVSIEGILIPPAKRVNMSVAAGDYLISVTAEGYSPSRETIIVEKSQHRVLAITLLPEDKTSAEKAFSGGTWSPEGNSPKSTNEGNHRKQTKVKNYRTYNFYITMYRKQYHHIKKLEMTIDDIPVTDLQLVNDMSYSSTLFKRTYRCSLRLKNGHHKCNFAGKLRTGFLTSSFTKERWITVNGRSSPSVKIKLGVILNH